MLFKMTNQLRGLYTSMDYYYTLKFSSQKTYTPLVTFYFVFTDAALLLQILFIWQYIDQQERFTLLSCQ